MENDGKTLSSSSLDKAPTSQAEGTDFESSLGTASVFAQIFYMLSWKKGQMCNFCQTPNIGSIPCQGLKFTLMSALPRLHANANYFSRETTGKPD